ncbi:hypothetical protein [uncultured Campylobacter sp.]|uniref:hypothetical protein n=1 Tax=uncultured Campylobacter sp. TaxID=218934 RepID=UPI00321192FB
MRADLISQAVTTKASAVKLKPLNLSATKIRKQTAQTIKNPAQEQPQTAVQKPKIKPKFTIFSPV